MKIAPIATGTYVRQVLPLTAELWAGERSFERYAADFVECRTSRYGKSSLRTLGLYENGEITASCKRYERQVHFRNQNLRAVGIGAVFTPAPLRGRGYASAFLAALLDREKQASTDLAYLFSDIHPTFYSALGFKELPSRSITLRADAIPMHRIAVEIATESDWAAIRKCFDVLEYSRAWGFIRTPTLWSWIEMVNKHHTGAQGQRVQLVIRNGKAICAYVFGKRRPATDSFVVDEFGFTDEHGRARLPSLLRACAGDLRKITGWLPPDAARDALPRGSVRKRKDAIFMIAPLSCAAKLLCEEEASGPRTGDRIWITDHI